MVQAADRGLRILMDPFMAKAYEEAMDTAQDPVVRVRLSSWRTARAGLAVHA
jgi:hypothetical protein